MKIPKTYSIDEDIYKSFEKLTDRLNVNKSSVIEQKITEYLKDNGISDYRTYFLKSNPEYEVTITGHDNTFVFLSDGSKILKPIFETSFKSVERIDPVDPVSFFKGEPLVIKLLLSNMDKWSVISKLEDDVKSNDKLTGKLFKREEDNKIFRVIEDNTCKWIRLRPNDENVKRFEMDLNINREFFLKSFIPHKICYMGIGGFAFEYLGESRIDGCPIFKLGGGIFIQFFNSDVDKLKDFIMNNRNVSIVTNNLNEKLYIQINDIQIVPMLENTFETIDSPPIYKYKSDEEIEKEDIKKAVNESMNSNIIASEKRCWDNDININGFANTPYEESLVEKLNRVVENADVNLEIAYILEVIDDIERGIFQKEVFTSGRIRSFIKHLEKIKTPDPNSELSKLKYKLLTKIVKYHNEIYG